ncbi:helix-turn-helix domain-containing protein [Paenibacillus whitsoniae]|uniref:AraC family transcriptional regulator n=1 Tax=Paenibacillus whitsoniae TaxID=2496558 RepID=A0A430J5U5_9BACL|nr:AraC family transcriptional regulator [Paenibacillus whitsoniae]RTE03047.1 AraC family transcriptional regulator [Paenibacillus whitsoniae]
MNAYQQIFWKKYIAQAKLDVIYASYTKVSRSWNDENPACPFNRLYMIMEGEGFVRIGEQVFYPKPGELYLLPAGSDQAYGTISDDTFGKFWCHFSAKIGDLDLFQILHVSPFIKVNALEMFKEKFERLISWSKDSAMTSELRLHAALLDLIADYIEQSPSMKLSIGGTPTFEKMNNVLDYMAAHLSEQVSIEELAQITHYHPNYFINAFKQFTGYSPIHYMNHLRAEKAKELLLTTELSVSQIAESFGMELSYFSRMFKEHTGFKPTGFRELRPR